MSEDHQRDDWLGPLPTDSVAPEEQGSAANRPADPSESDIRASGVGDGEKAASVTRSVDLEASPDAVWEAVADPDRRGAWLDDDDATSRMMRTDGIDPGRSLTWTWWRPDDESGASQVHIALTELDDGSTRVAVTERLLAPQTALSRPGTASMQASVSMQTSVARSPLWDSRLLGLELLVVAAGALVG
jgi:uncharacterized protein YndB with AHSA1/START domain